MQYIIEVSPEQDLQFLLKLLEKMQVVYRPVDVPQKAVKKAVKKTSASDSQASRFHGKLTETAELKPSERFYGKLSSKTADALLKYVEESRNEWERTF